MEILEVFLLSIAIGLVIHLIVRWSGRYKSRTEDKTSVFNEQTTEETALGSALGEVERELKESFSGKKVKRDCSEEAITCANCIGSCSESERASERTPRIVYYDDEELDVLAHRPIESYTEKELEMLREVAETLLESDYEGWLKSLSMRSILLPPDILHIVTP